MKFNVWMRSKTGFYEQYAGKVVVDATSVEGAIERAFQKLARTYPERNRAMWIVERVDSFSRSEVRSVSWFTQEGPE